MAVYDVQLAESTGAKKHEQRMWKEFTKKIRDEWGEDERDIHILGSVNIKGLECDCILITSNCLCIIDFKAHEGEIELRNHKGGRLDQFTINASWYLKGTDKKVEGGSRETPFLQIRRSKWDGLKKHIEKLNESVPLIDLGDFTNPSGMVLFRGDTVFPYQIPKSDDSMHKWFHVTNMDSVISCIQIIEGKAKLGLANEEMEAIVDKIAYDQEGLWKKCTARSFERPHTGAAKASQSDTRRATRRSDIPPTPPRTPKSSARPHTGPARAPRPDTRQATPRSKASCMGRIIKVLLFLFLIFIILMIMKMGGDNGAPGVDNKEQEGVIPGSEPEPAGTGRMSPPPQEYVVPVEIQNDASAFAGEMVVIPGGTFRMGDLSGAGQDNERPVRSVEVPSFRIGKYEVTFAQWDDCVAGGGCRGYRPDDGGWGRDNRPVINVSWNDAQLFIDWLNDNTTGGGYRLPTEAEWEYAARADGATIYSWGNDIVGNKANCDGCRNRWDGDRTTPVGTFAANAWGLHDMAGNVFEWVEDCWHENYQGAPVNGGAWTSDCEDYNSYNSRRVLRGGSWYSYEVDLRSASRDGNTPGNRRNDLGFRLARDN